MGFVVVLKRTSHPAPSVRFEDPECKASLHGALAQVNQVRQVNQVVRRTQKDFQGISHQSNDTYECPGGPSKCLIRCPRSQYPDKSSAAFQPHEPKVQPWMSPGHSGSFRVIHALLVFPTVNAAPLLRLLRFSAPHRPWQHAQDLGPAVARCKELRTSPLKQRRVR